GSNAGTALASETASAGRRLSRGSNSATPRAGSSASAENASSLPHHNAFEQAVADEMNADQANVWQLLPPRRDEELILPEGVVQEEPAGRSDVADHERKRPEPHHSAARRAVDEQEVGCGS